MTRPVQGPFGVDFTPRNLGVNVVAAFEAIALSADRFLVFVSYARTTGGTAYPYAQRACLLDGTAGQLFDVVGDHWDPLLNGPAGVGPGGIDYIRVRISATSILEIDNDKSRRPGSDPHIPELAVRRLSVSDTTFTVDYDVSYLVSTAWVLGQGTPVVYEPRNKLVILATFDVPHTFLCIDTITGALLWTYEWPDTADTAWPTMSLFDVGHFDPARETTDPRSANLYAAGDGTITVRWLGTAAHAQSFTVTRFGMAPHGPRASPPTDGPITYYATTGDTGHGPFDLVAVNPDFSQSVVAVLPPRVGPGGNPGVPDRYQWVANDPESGAIMAIIYGESGDLSTDIDAYVWGTAVGDTAYLRMNQRDDGLGISGHPRLLAGKNSTAAPRVGAYKKFI